MVQNEDSLSLYSTINVTGLLKMMMTIRLMINLLLDIGLQLRGLNLILGSCCSSVKIEVFTWHLRNALMLASLVSHYKQSSYLKVIIFNKNCNLHLRSESPTISVSILQKCTCVPHPSQYHLCIKQHFINTRINHIFLHINKLRTTTHGWGFRIAAESSVFN